VKLDLPTSIRDTPYKVRENVCVTAIHEKKQEKRWTPTSPDDGLRPGWKNVWRFPRSAGRRFAHARNQIHPETAKTLQPYHDG
jgi:hypothetical protein